MSIRIVWSPNTDSDIASYDIEKSTAIDGTFTLLVNIPHDPLGANWDGELDKFFYEDLNGTTSTFYRLKAVDEAGNRSQPSAPFQVPGTAPDVHNTVRVDHTYGRGAFPLRYQTSGGVPIEAAVIRIFKKIDFDTGQTDTAIAVTQTNARGDWVSPVFLETGFTYTVLFYKDGLYGPDAVEIIV